MPDRLTLYGTVTADRTAAVSSRVMANVVAVPARVGQSVAAGDVLVEIDPQTAKGQEAQARGALAQARAALSLAERNYERYKALAASGSASPLELDMARMQYEQAKGAVQQGEGAVEAASSVARESRVDGAVRRPCGRAPRRGRRPRGPGPPARHDRVRDGPPPRRSGPGRHRRRLGPQGRAEARRPDRRRGRRPDGHRRRDVARRRPGEPHVHGDARAVGRARRDRPHGPRDARRPRSASVRPRSRKRRPRERRRQPRRREGRRRQGAHPRRDDRRRAGRQASRSSPASPAARRSSSASRRRPPTARPSPSRKAPRRRELPGEREYPPREGRARGAAPQDDAPAPRRLGADREGLPRVQAHAAPRRRLAPPRRLRGPHHAARGGAADQGPDDRRLRRAPRRDAPRRSSAASSPPSRRRSTRSRTSSTSTRPRSPRAGSIIVRFLVGTDPDQAVVRVHAKIAELPAEAPARRPAAGRRAARDRRRAGRRLHALVEATRRRCSSGRSPTRSRPSSTRHPRVAQVTVLGGQRRVVSVTFDRDRLASLRRLARPGAPGARRASTGGSRPGSFSTGNAEVPRSRSARSSAAPRTSAPRWSASANGKPVCLKDVAAVADGPEEPSQYAWMLRGAGQGLRRADAPAVTLAVAKKPGTNAVDAGAGAGRPARAGCKGPVVPSNVDGHEDARLRQDGQREVVRADLPRGARDALGRAPDGALPRPARGGRRRSSRSR